MTDTQSENPVPVPSEVETAESPSLRQNVKTGNKSAELEIEWDIDFLYTAAAEGKIDAFKEYKEKKPLEQLVTPNKNTILHIHITARPPDPVIKGIHKLIDILFPCAHKTARFKKERSLKFVEEILEMCPDLLWQVNNKDETLLHMAARHGHDDIVELLIRKLKETHHNDQEKGVGAARQMLRMTNIAKDTAMHEAVRFNHFDVVERLISEDSDYSYGVNAAGETPIYLAAERGYFWIVFLTADGQDYGGPNGRTALHAAVLRNDLGITWRILYETNTLTQIKDEGGWIPLHYAAYYGYIDLAEVLLDYDKSTAYAKTDDDKKTALHIAASHGNVDMMEMIISLCPGCSELVDERGWNVLHFAIESRNTKAVKLVLENPSLSNLINEYNSDGNTPLHQLAALGFYMSSFIRHPKVDKQAVNKQQLNALDITSGMDEFSKEQKYLKHCLRENGIVVGQRVLFNKDEGNREGEGQSINDSEGTNKDDIIADNNEAKEAQRVLLNKVVVNKDEGNREGEGRSSNDSKGTNKDDDVLANIKEARAAHLVVATLIATVTFAAGFTVPGGYKGEGSPDKGTAILIKSAAFKVFVIADTIAMMLSSSAVFLHLFMALDRDKSRIISQFIQELHFTIFAMYAMVVAFITGTYAILAPPSWLSIAVCVLGCIFGVLYGYFISRSIFDLLEFLSEKIKSLRPQNSKAELEKVKKKLPQKKTS